MSQNINDEQGCFENFLEESSQIYFLDIKPFFQNIDSIDSTVASPQNEDGF